MLRQSIIGGELWYNSGRWFSSQLSKKFALDVFSMGGNTSIAYGHGNRAGRASWKWQTTLSRTLRDSLVSLSQLPSWSSKQGYWCYFAWSGRLLQWMNLLPAWLKGGSPSDSERDAVAAKMARYAGISKEAVLSYNLMVPTSFFWKSCSQKRTGPLGRLG